MKTAYIQSYNESNRINPNSRKKTEKRIENNKILENYLNDNDECIYYMVDTIVKNSAVTH